MVTSRPSPQPSSSRRALPSSRPRSPAKSGSRAALRDVGVALGTTLDLDQLLELILEKITDLLEADRATLYLLDEAKGELVSRIAVGDAIRSVRIKVGEGIAGMVARTGKTHARARTPTATSASPASGTSSPATARRSILASPMKNHLGRTIGVVQVLNKKSRREFTAHDEALLTALATEAAVSIDNSRLFLSVIQKNMQLLETKEKLEQSVRHLKLLFDLESAMGRAASHEELIRGVLRESAQPARPAEARCCSPTPRTRGLEVSQWDEAPARRARIPGVAQPRRQLATPSGQAWAACSSDAMEQRRAGAGHREAVDDDATRFQRRRCTLGHGRAAAKERTAPPMGAIGLYNKTDGRPSPAKTSSSCASSPPTSAPRSSSFARA